MKIPNTKNSTMKFLFLFFCWCFSTTLSFSSSVVQEDIIDIECYDSGCPLLPHEFSDPNVMKELRLLDQASSSTLTTFDDTESEAASYEVGVDGDGQAQKKKSDDDEDDDDEIEKIDVRNLSISTSFLVESELIEVKEAAATPVEGVSAATLTLAGQKGPSMKINQDRSFVLNPFYITENSNNNNNNNNEDEKVVEQGILLGVFDGHGFRGEEVSQYTLTDLPNVLSRNIFNKLYTNNNDNNKDDATDKDRDTLIKEALIDDATDKDRDTLIKEALIQTFLEIDDGVPTDGEGGCTASIILQLDKKLYVANAGDSRSFLTILDSFSGNTKVMYITREDKPDLPDEKERIEKSGGQVYIPPPHKAKSGSSSRTMCVNAKTGQKNWLAMSRSIGDLGGKHLGLIAEPIVDIFSMEELLEEYTEQQEKEINKQDLKLIAISATDGMMDHVTPERISDVIGSSYGAKNNKKDYAKVQKQFQYESNHLLISCADLIVEAAIGWASYKSGSYRDDIAISVAYL